MKNYERFLRNRDGGRERTIKSSERLSSEGSNYQKFLKGRETQLEEESDFSRYLKTRQQRNLLEDKRQERESYLDSERDVSLWDAVTSDKTMDDWKQSRAWKKQNQQEIDEAAAQVAAYEQFERDKIFQSEVENMTSADLDKIISDYDRQIGEIKNEGGFWNAVAPGGIKPSEYSENKDKINALQSEQGRYRAVRDEKKSREMTEGLPEDVIELLDEYNSIGNVSQANQIASVLAPESSMMYQSGNYESSLRRQEIAKELTEKGYANYAELAEYRQHVKDVESNRQSEEEFAEFAKEHPVASSAMSIALAPASSIAGTIGTAENVLKDKNSDLGANPYDSWYFLDTYKNKTRETVPETFEDGVVSAKTKRFLYNTGMSAADSALMGVTMGGTGAALLGASAMNDTYVDVLKKGGTDEQALLSGVAAGAAEGFFEKVSLGRFTKTVDAKSVKDIVKNVMVEAGVNASEEAFTEISNIATDYFINGGLSDGYQTYEGYLKQGLSKEQAIKATAKDMGSRVFEAAASGALMGAGFGTYNSARNAVEYNSAMQDIGRNIVENNAVEKELAAASELGVNENDALFKFAKEVEAYQSKKNQNEAYEGTKREMRSLGRLSEGLDVVASDKIKDTSTNAIKDRLSALGEEGNIDDVSSVVLKKATGEKLTKKENHILQKSKYGVRVINELTERGITSSEWADKVDSNIDDIVKSRNTPDIEAYKSGNTSEKAAETAVTTEKDETPYGFENYEKQVKEKIINEGQDKERFDSDFELFKQYGEAGRRFEEVKSNSTVSKDFTEVQMKSAFDIGVQKAEAKKMTVLKGVKGVDESGEIYVIDSKDQTRKLSEINTDETTRNLYKSAAKYDTAAANVFVQGYNRSASVSSYRTAFNAFYSAGTAGQRSFSEVMKDNSSLVRYMADKAYAEKAFDIGRQERLNADKAVYQKKQTGNFPAKGVYQSKTISTGAEAVDEFYTAVSKKLGLDVDRVQSIVNRNGQEANAQYDPTKHKMTVSASAQNEWQASVHELTHAAFSYNSAKMKEVKKAIVDYYLKNNSEADLESILEQYKLAYEGDSRADIEEEFIADALGGMFSTEDGVQDFLNWLQNESGYNAEKKKDILQRITEWLSDIIEAIKEIMNDGELNGAGKLFAKQQCDELAKIRKMFLEALDGAGVNYREKGAVEGDVRNSIKETKITPDMSEKDRAEVLKNTKLNVVKYEGNDELNSASVLKLKFSYNSKASKILKALGEKFDIFKGYSNENVEIDFYYSRGSLNESVHKQGDISTNFYDFARMLYVFDDVIKNAVPIEVHTDKYKDTKRADRNLKYDYVLLSAFSDDSHIVPVELHIKEYKTPKTENKLYVSITLGKIKIEDNVKVQTADRNQRNNTQLSSIVSLPQLISKINPEYGNFYKYIPKSLLNESQIKSKEIAEADEDYRLKVMRGEDVSHILKDKAHQKGYDTDFSYRMDHRAPSAKYDICITDIDRAYGGDGSIYSQYAAHYYGDGRAYDYKAINVIKKARSSPESLITIYRAVPTNIKDTRIRNGDWVTIVKDYADEHGWRTLDDDYRIIENKVPAKYLFTDGNSIHEFGYDNGNTNEVYKNTDNNVKVTEVTYDERGQLIPLSKRFDDGKSDIRYSLPLSNLNDLHASNIEKVTELGRVEAQLTAHINYIGSSQTKRTLSTLNIQAVARELKKEYHSKADIHELTAELESLYKLFEQGRVSQDVVKAHVDSITEKIINESVYMKPDISDYAKEILSELRSVKIKLSDVQKQQAAYHFGSYNEFRKALMGSVVLSEEGSPLDERWQSLCGMFPGRFDSETVDTDQPYALSEAIKELRNTYDDESGLDIDSVKAQLSADICAGYISIPTVAQYSNQYSVLEQELLQSLKAEKQMYKQIYSQAYKNAQSEYGLQLKKMRADQAEEILRAKARMNQRVENIADTRLREKKRNRLIKTVKRLDRLLRKPDRAAPSAGTNKYGQEYVHLTNIPEGLKKTVIDFCSIFIENDAGVFTGKFTDSENVVRKKINELRKQYQNLKSSEAYISTVVSDDMTEKLEKMHEIVADKRLAQLTATELDSLNEIADHLITVINNEVEMWVNGKKTKVNDIGKAALSEQNAKGMKGYIQAMKGIDKINVMNLKPIYFFEKVGGTLEKLWDDILGGQDRYVRNMQYAQQKFSSIAKKYNLDSWIDDDAKTFKTEQGHEISLTRGQALLVWATWKREGSEGKGTEHLFEGGIVFPEAVKKASDKGKNKLPDVLQKVYEDGTAHRIRIEDMLKIDEWLTKEQKAYADELVSFLSNDVAGWGNEISMQLYGVNKFNLKYYIPFNSAGNYLYKGMGDEGTKLLKSEGFTKETQWGANNPLVVDDFTQVVVRHIERMSMYNSMVIPLDNFSRVWNYQERADADSNDSTQNVKAAFETAWGKEYKKYVDNLLRDINGGVMSDSREISDKWISKFKKAAVMSSASVMIQQPSAIVRAFSEVDTKYFVASTFAQRKKAYEEAKKYAPVAVLKEIGGFDTVGGQSMTDWMLKRDYKGKDKLKALFKDSQFRDDVISWGPAFADRVTWAHIWLACKKEVQHKGYDGKKGLTGEALLEAAGKRFTEVINKTQVYDSVLSRSDAMRSKSTLMKMQTAFMAEPVTQWNMYGSALRDLRTHGARAKGARKIAAVVGAQAFNSILVSMIYAARDDDEEKTLLEKYLGEVVGNFLDSLNPLALVPFFKDIISLLQGYNVERSDMSVFANLVDSITDLWNKNLSGKEKAFGFAGSTLDVFGVPFKNFVRDGKALVNTARSLSAGQQSTDGGIRASIKDEIFPILKNIGVISDKKGDLLYDAWIKSDKSLYAEYASRYKDGKAVKSALTSQIKDRYLKGSLGEEDVTVQLSRLGYSENDVYYKLREWDAPEQTEETNTEDENEAYLTIDGINSLSSVESDDEGGVSYVYLHNAIAQRDEALIKSEIEDLMNRGAEEKQIKMSVQSKWGRAYRESLDPNERKEIERMIAATGLWRTGEVFGMTRRWRRQAEEEKRKQ